ncbi:hypothetical protein UC34_17430 [Pandoraea vervacti]|uniref:Uncharacterized protein n=1 Tax=Pandoraea vervacti TaxID=656178 RepID=A0ABM5T0T2_9BURK|nr:hypothetical protein [Pandoraea vervacti]AJP58271.1 hypothetical protein UC34_17430 [Pandoraea vervacti]
MATPIPSITLNLSGGYGCMLDATTLEKCTTTHDADALTSLWGKIKDWFFGTHAEAAKRALHQLAHPTSPEAQFDAFARLLEYVAPQDRGKLTWHVEENKAPCFRVDDYSFDAPQDWRAQQWTEKAAPDMARLLLSLHYRGKPALSELGDTCLNALAERAMRMSGTDDVALNAETIFESLRWQLPDLIQKPALIHALELIGMQWNDERDGLADNVEEAVTQTLLSGIDTSDEDLRQIAGVAGAYANALVRLTTHMVRDRDAFMRVRLALNLPLNTSQSHDRMPVGSVIEGAAGGSSAA